MSLIDLSQAITEDMPVYPGTDKPKIDTVNSIDSDGFCETMLCMTSHTGTHIDAPAHILVDAPTLDKLPIELFYGLARIIDVSKYCDQQIPLSIFQDKQEELQCCNFVILKSKHDRYWGSDLYFKNYPVLSLAAGRFLAKLPCLRGIGIDMNSVDTMDGRGFPLHNIFFAAGKIIIENLTNLDAIKGDTVELCVMPLKLINADGAPTRAIAFENI